MARTDTLNRTQSARGEEMRYQTLLVEIKDKVAKVILNRPDKKNAMNPQLHKDMTAVLEALRYNENAAVLVITGAGESFRTGMDLKQFFHELKSKPAEYDRILRMAVEWRGRTLRQFPKPTIAMVNGYCFGGAFSIVEGCDLAVAADEAQFGLSEINFRLFPGGSVSKALARELAGKDPVALRACKDAYRVSLEMPWDAAISYAVAKEHEVFVLQKGAWVEQGIGDFVKGLYKPGLGGHGDGKG